MENMESRLIYVSSNLLTTKVVLPRNIEISCYAEFKYEQRGKHHRCSQNNDDFVY